MNNQELELKVKEILVTSNFFDMMENAITFEKEYKRTDFYKKTKLPLIEVIKYAKMWYMFNFDGFGKKIQEVLDGLDLTNINNILNQFGEVYGQENEEIMSIIKEFQTIVK